LEIEGRRVCEGLVRDWVNWYYAAASSLSANDHPARAEPMRLLEQAIAGLAHPNEPMTVAEPRRVFVDVSQKYPVLNMPYGGVAFPHWSAAVRRIVSLAYLMIWTFTEHAEAAQLRKEEPTNRLVLLIDEIEAHLHPKWQRVILPSLLMVAEALKPGVSVQIISTTHSPLVLASLEPHFKQDRDRFFCFNLEDGQVTFQDVPWSMHGDTVAWLTSEVFGLEQARSSEAERAIESAEAFLRRDAGKLPSGLQTKDEITAELKRVLPGLDPFWPRWIVETKS